jgi:hypothetical protein
MSLGYSIFNPPAYHTTMITDPTQPPTQIYPYGGGGSPYGPYPGFYTGNRTFTQDDAIRHSRAQQKFMEHRAEVSSDPSHKYLTSQGRLDPRTAAALRAARVPGKREDPIKKIQKRMLLTILLGAVLSALLK